MKKILLVLAIPAVLVVVTACTTKTTSTNTAVNTAGTTNTSGPVQTSSVSIKNFAFSPATITVQPGTTVTWTNQDSATHTVNSTSFNSGNLSTGQTFTHAFTAAGTYNYTCGIHPSMQGTVIVQ